jgi:galactose mutarotase-like enzyme
MKSSLLFQNQTVLQLADAENRVLVSAEKGARVLSWTRAGREVIPWPENADWNRYRKIRGGDPVLFPFPARHYVDGTNELWRDAQGVVRSMPQHGFAVDAPFTVIEGGPENELRMRLTDTETTRVCYPFNFKFDVVVALLPGSRLEVRFETTNMGGAPLPYYAGHHFYFAIPHTERADWTLDLPCARWGKRGDNGSVVDEPATADTFPLSDPAAIDRFNIQPKSSRLTLRHGPSGRQLLFDLDHPGMVPWYVVTTWSEKPESDFYCIEPWLGIANAIHHGQGLRWLAGGKTEKASVILDGSGW